MRIQKRQFVKSDLSEESQIKGLSMNKRRSIHLQLQTPQRKLFVHFLWTKSFLNNLDFLLHSFKNT